MRKILLIGNGPSVRDYELGELIDSYDKVVRFNWYHIEGYERYVGTKTNIWFTTVFDPVRAKKDYDITYWHSWNWNLRTDVNYWKVCNAREKFCPGVMPPIKTFPELVAEMCSFMNDCRGKGIKILNHPDHVMRSWSTGAIATWWFLNFGNRYPDPGTLGLGGVSKGGAFDVTVDHLGHDQIHLYGFDWWEMASDSKHHYGDSQTVGNLHNPQQELEFFNYLWQMGKIHDLHPDSEFHHPPSPPDE